MPARLDALDRVNQGELALWKNMVSITNGVVIQDVRDLREELDAELLDLTI